MSRWMRKRGLIAAQNPKSAAADTYRRLKTGIEWSVRDEGMKTIAIASAEPGEGKSTTSSNIAVAYAKAGRRVLLLDTDLRSPVQHQIFDLPNDAGLSTALAGRGELDQVARRTAYPNLQVVCAGPMPHNPSELLDSEAMSAMLEAAKARFDIVIVDTTSMAAASDAMIVADKCDGAVLVIRKGKTSMDAVLKAKETLSSGRVRVVGAVFNRRGR
ncbi:CpsD/CapB family tyrosine-protein kinase [Cohnella ginsengisoli]|uniref:non-specific protein-tyrosine kinase n=1 Tax=Cohnella ginsengisoli TaxID=425004 RepID=A0A9X4KG15_9BACL|nr:CpsD/CapB family tyrosine-protein kinase [Cohnella ginsengisoli]MDG0791468.1 CpsD/CapB family tyrosine-protein kinase [Cohnella ginsengisoli]